MASKITKFMSKHILVINFLCIFGSVGQVVGKCSLHYCKEHILDYNVHNMLNESMPLLLMFIGIFSFYFVLS